jgi:F-type H+-transporting ATPase subunit b
MEIFKTLGIDATLLLAQIINFGIVAAVLTYLVYKPLLKVIDERRERTKKAMRDADDIGRAKRDMEEERIKRMRAADDESKAMLEKAKKHAESVQTELLAKARSEADAALQKGRTQLENERREALSSLQDTVAKVVIGMTEKILGREFASADQERILKNLEKELPALLK